jgi:hypothetical protein
MPSNTANEAATKAQKAYTEKLLIIIVCDIQFIVRFYKNLFVDYVILFRANNPLLKENS